MKSNFFDPHKSFLSLTVVKGTAITLLSFSITIAIVIAFNSELSFSWSYQGFNMFFSVFRFPLAVAALIIPVIALLAANHRSEQTKEQIRVTNEQNVFSNYYKHIEEFSKYLSERAEKNVDLRFAHHNIYPYASSGDYTINPELFTLLTKLDHIVQDIESSYTNDLNEGLTSSIQEYYGELICDLYNFMHRDRQDYVEYITIRKGVQNSSSFLYLSVNYIHIAIKVISRIELLCKFSVDYVSPITHLSSPHLKLGNLYVHKKPEGSSGLDLGPSQKEEQTLEQATNKLLEQLQQAQADN